MEKGCGLESFIFNEHGETWSPGSLPLLNIRLKIQSEHFRDYARQLRISENQVSPISYISEVGLSEVIAKEYENFVRENEVAKYLGLSLRFNLDHYECIFENNDGEFLHYTLREKTE